jgi:hypothetical protein
MGMHESIVSVAVASEETDADGFHPSQFLR